MSLWKFYVITIQSHTLADAIARPHISCSLSDWGCTVLSISFSFFPLTSNCCRGISCGGCRWMALRCPGLQTILPKGSCWYCSRSHPKAPSCYLSFAFLSPIWSSHLSDRKVTQSQDLTFMRGMTLINDKFYDSVQS